MHAILLFLLGFAAWLAVVFGPPLLGVTFWHGAQERVGPWIAHLFFLPTVMTLDWAKMRVIFFVAGDDGEGPPGLRLALLLPLAIFVGTIVIYYIAVASTLIRTGRRRTRVR